MKPKLTTREVLKLILAEHTSSEIAEKLNISLDTVRSPRKNLLGKFEARNSVGLAQRVFQYRMELIIRLMQSKTLLSPISGRYEK